MIDKLVLAGWVVVGIMWVVIVWSVISRLIC